MLRFGASKHNEDPAFRRSQFNYEAARVERDARVAKVEPPTMRVVRATKRVIMLPMRPLPYAKV